MTKILTDKVELPATNKQKIPKFVNMYYRLNRLLSYDPANYWFYIAIGSRGRGKTTAAWKRVLKRFLEHEEMFIWLRLTDAPIKMAKDAQGSTLIPRFILEQLNIKGCTIKGSAIYITYAKEDEVITKQVGIMDSISTFYKSKGLTRTEYTNIVFDEINRESGERNTFDLTRAFINQLESICRMRKLRILMLGNKITDVSDIMDLFKFQPREFGIYKLTRRKCIIEYMEDSEEFKEARKNSIAGILIGDNEEENSSFTNKTVNYDENLKVFNGNELKQVFTYYITQYRAFGVYTSKKLKGYYIGENRSKTCTAYKISPFINCEGKYDDEIYKAFYELISQNALYYETSSIRLRFTSALRHNRTTMQ